MLYLIYSFQSISSIISLYSSLLSEKAWSAQDLKKTQKQGTEIKRAPISKRLSDKVELPKQNVSLNPEKQSKHTTDGKIFLDHLAKTGKKYSYFTITTSELENLIKSYAGSGYKHYSKNKQTGRYLWDNKEIIVENHKKIGYVVKEDGTEIPTRYFKIHYSKTGVHLVPLDPKMGDKYAKIHTEGVSISLHGRD